MWIVGRIQRITCQPVKSDEDSASGCISDTEDGIYWNGDLDNPNDSEDDCMVDVESNLE
jgi:hypothetical protein